MQRDTVEGAGTTPADKRTDSKASPGEWLLSWRTSGCGGPKDRKDIPVHERHVSISGEGKEWKIKLNSLEKLTCLE